MTAAKSPQRHAPAWRRRLLWGAAPYSAICASFLRKRASTKLLILALFALVYLALCSSAPARWFVALRTSLKAPSWNVDIVPGEGSVLDRAKRRNGHRPAPAGTPAGRGRDEPISQAAHDTDMIDNLEAERPVFNLNDPTHRELLERLSAYRVDMFLDKARRPLYDPDPNPAAQIAIGDFPWVGTSLSPREKQKFKPPRLLGSILGPMPNPWDIYPNPSTLDTVASIPDVSSSRYEAKEEVPVAGHPPRLIPVSAVLVKEPGQSLGPLQLITSQLAKYPFFREIVIWNNDPTVEISGQEFEVPNAEFQPPVRVFNSTEDAKDLAKYLACNMATLGTCYFQSSAWLNPQVDALYTSFIRFPHLIHAAADRASFLQDRRWTFTSSDNLHAGFAVLDRGAFAPKSAVNRFLRQAGWAGLPRERLNRADAYFTIWTNQYPVQLEVPLVSLKRRSSADSASRDPKHALDAARILERTLRRDPQNFLQDPFLRKELGPPWNARDARTPCHNTECIFITNMDALPAPSSVPFAPDVASMSAHTRKFHFSPAAIDHVLRYSYHAAVDGDETTCWSSWKPPAAGDYFGLHFIMPRTWEFLTVPWVHGTSMLLDDGIAVEVSVDGIIWNTCRHLIQNDGHHVALALECEDAEAGSEEPGATGVTTFVRVVALRNFSSPLRICSIKVDGMTL